MMLQVSAGKAVSAYMHQSQGGGDLQHLCQQAKKYQAEEQGSHA